MKYRHKILNKIIEKCLLSAAVANCFDRKKHCLKPVAIEFKVSQEVLKELASVLDLELV